MKKLKSLVGKTISGINLKGYEKYPDDENYLELQFTDGTKTIFRAVNGEYTGNSKDEYPVFIEMLDNHYSDLKSKKANPKKLYSQEYAVKY